jgi:hypothetical protein
MAKKYDLWQSNKTWDWNWRCQDGSHSGNADSKRVAKREAKAACADSFAITPPPIDAQVNQGQLANFSVYNLDGERVSFSSAEISQETFLYVVGMDCANPKELDSAKIAAAILKIWGVYRGGMNADSIRKRHCLSTKQFDRLVQKKFAGMTLTVNDDGSLTWANR